MGTRGLTVVVHEGQHKIAQYGQWDHYPSGQGLTALRFLRRMMEIGNREKFVAQLGKCRWATEEDYAKARAAAGMDPDQEWMTNEQSEACHAALGGLMHRNHGAGILDLVFDTDAEEIVLRDSYDFAADSLFCEWAYVIDLDELTFEVYKGFNEFEAVGRFKDLPKHGAGNYSPVTLVAKIDIVPLPLPSDDEFLAAVGYKEDEE